MNKAVYAFSGDPITYGHIDIIKRAAKIFDEIIVAIGVNPDKSYVFSLEERLDMAEKSLSMYKNVKVMAFRGLLVDFAYENNASVIIRGIRDTGDFGYEKLLYLASESQKLGIETCPFFAKQDLVHISSSTVKALQKEQGLIHEYVSIYVKKCVEEKMSGQFIVGVTGEIGSGKSYISDMLKTIAKKQGIEVHNIELDNIGHEILEELKEEKYIKIREEIVNTFGKEVQNIDGTINRKVLGNIVFEDAGKLNKLNSIMNTPILVRLRRKLYDKKGIILVNAALIAEAEMTYICNNNIIFINANKETQSARLKDRGYSDEQINHRIKSQYDSSEKQVKIEEIIKKDNYGNMWIIDNSYNLAEKDIEGLLLDIRNYFKI
ncbi:MAG: hypothetical protein A2Y22_05480 [Clostridiales bacterium GWD2_32_59]|nr:MAG: hypothetical protein A2Y22_05480 [Clostridiales bacterium GWD2_32_59]